MTIRVLVACQEEGHARTLCQQLVHAATKGFVAADATALGSVVGRTARLQPDVLLLECNPLELEAIREILSQLSGSARRTRVLMLWDSYRTQSLIAFVHDGASGCLLTSSAPSLYLKAIASVHAGETWFGRTDLLEAMRAQLANHPGDAARAGQDEHLLTRREREILNLIGTGMTNKEIARALAISDQTVKTHLHNIYVKLEHSGRYKAFQSRPGTATGPAAAMQRGGE